MFRPRSLVALAALAGALTLAACSSPEPSATPTASEETTAGDASLSSTTEWADTVCTSLGDVRQAIDGIGEGLSVNPLAGSDALDEARTQIETQVAAVGTSVAELREAIAAAPDDEGAQQIRASLEGSLDELEAAGQEVSEQAQAAANATSAADFVAAAGGALGAIQDAGGAVGDLFSAATGSASEESSEARAAFAAAPACQALRG